MKSKLLILLSSITLITSVSCGGYINKTDSTEYTAVNPAAANSQTITQSNNSVSFPVSDKANTFEQPKKLTEVTELNILTFNTWGVWKYVTKSLEKRVELITTAINGFDMVNLQETTVKETKDITDKNSFYPYKIRYDNTSFMKWGSGLSTLSKYPVVEKKFMKFSSCAGLDCNNNKGVLFLRLEVPKLGQLDFYNTHYQSMPFSTKQRLQANKDFEKFFRENTVNNLAIITGDFNFTDKDDDFKDFVTRFKAIDTFKTRYPNDPGYSYDKTKNKNAFLLAEPQRIDFIFVIPNEKYNVEIIDSKLMFTEPKDGLFLSDHFGLSSSLKISLNSVQKN